MSSVDERIANTVGQHRAQLQTMLDRQRQSFLADGPPSTAVRRNRIDRLMARVAAVESSDP
jgi:coniferyl-aldehyde dehydrogenase